MKKKKNHTIHMFLLVFIVCLVVLSNVLSRVELDASNYCKINKGWDIEINDAEYENVVLSEFAFSALDRGDVLKMKCELPKQDIVSNPILRIYTIHSDIEVRYNNRIIYEYGKELREENELLGYGYHFVHIPAFYAGADIELIMHITEDDVFTNMEIPEICNSDAVIRDFIIINRVPLSINLFLVVFGILVLFVSIIFCIYDKRFFKLFCVGCFSLGIGCWSICSYDLILLFTFDMRMKAFLEFGSLYVSPLFVLLYFWNDELVTRHKGAYIGYKLLLAVQCVFVLMAFLLQILNIVHFPVVLKIQHCILLCLCIGVIVLTVIDIIKKQLRNKVLIIGITVMLSVGLFDIISFSAVKYLGASGEARYTSITCIGAIIFVISQLVDFGMEIGNIFLKGAKAQVLEQMAYIDDMTGVANRRRCEQVWDSLDQSKENYGIFAFDLNFLKQTNDTKGHAVGDLLIRTFAKTLSKVFGDYGVVGRIGGDEFVVFITDVKKVDIQALTKMLDKEIEKVNEQNPDLGLSTAYGFCSHEDYPEDDSRKLYRKADEIMYENKMAMKAARD
ncbi:MAG: GGDEF domain-containing protein [Lachnospiraceae bacterium]|nr:GGDEF domain-containing protein [Lachnospiraceae bacterium]